MRRRYRRVTPKKTNNKWFKIIAIGLMIILALAVLFISLKVFVAQSHWDGKSKFAFATPTESGDVGVTVIDPATSTLLNITIPKNTLVNAANHLGEWKIGSIYSLDKQEDLDGQLLKSTLLKTFHMPIDAWSEEAGRDLISSSPIKIVKSIFGNYQSDISIKDKLKLAFYALRARNTSRISLDLAEAGQLSSQTLPDGEEGYALTRNLSPSVLSYFTDSSLSQKGLRIELINRSGYYKIAPDIAQSLEVMGGRVMAIQNQDIAATDCEVTGGEATAVDKIAQVFGCEVEKTELTNNFDIQFTFGSSFADRY